MLCLIPSYFCLIDRKKSSNYIAIRKLALSVLFCSILSYSQLVNDVDEIGETIYVICLIPFYCSVLFLILTHKKRLLASADLHRYTSYWLSTDPMVAYRYRMSNVTAPRAPRLQGRRRFASTRRLQ